MNRAAGGAARSRRTGTAPITQTALSGAWCRRWLRRQLDAGSMSSSRMRTTSPAASSTAALHAAARPRRGPPTTRSGYGASNEASASVVPSSEPSTATTTSKSPGGTSWPASADRARMTDSRRRYVGITTLTEAALMELRCENELRAVECFCVAALGGRLHPAEAQEGTEEVVREPVPVVLRGEVLQEQTDLPADRGLVERDVDVRRGEVRVPLRDLVLEDEVV